MKKNIIVYTLLISFLFIPKAFCADVAKIGVVFMEKVMVESSAGKMINKQLAAKRNEVIKIMEAEKKEVEAMGNELKKMALLPVPVDKKKKAEKENVFEKRKEAFFKMERRLTNELKQLNDSLMKPFYSAVNQIIRAIGKKEGYSLILERREAGVFYIPSDRDITDSVTLILNQKTAQEK